MVLGKSMLKAATEQVKHNLVRMLRTVVKIIMIVKREIQFNKCNV